MPQLSDRTRTVIAWTVVAPCVLWALIRLLGLDRGYPLVPLMAFTPYVVIVSLAAAGAAAALRRWAPAALGGLVAIVLALVVLPRVIPDGDPVSGGEKLRVMTANVRRSEADLDTVVKLVRQERVDLLSVQELTPRGAAVLRRRGLDRLLRFHVLSVGGSTYGSGIFSRFPLRGQGLSPAEFRQPRAVMRMPEGETIHVVCVHPIPPGNFSAVRRWSDALHGLPGTTREGPRSILAGDFNATLDQDALRDVVATGYRDAAEAEGRGLTPTWPFEGRSSLPPVTIDHILADERLGISDYEVRELPGSDHRAVVATLWLGSADSVSEPD
jgi:endonuclease/exonuclease/phosphatase (EEP) superfamily protein YafD